jgi:arginyl-tRNA--protein-N-Asp/Glu arginylyltransferase
MSYLSWQEQTITDFSENNIDKMYADGYVFTRKGKGVMQQTRSVRIDMSKFELSSENRRILKKNEGLTIKDVFLPLGAASYDFSIGKLAKDFYDTKFGIGIMSAQKVKEMLTDSAKSNFNLLLQFTIPYPLATSPSNGYSICHKNSELIHYSYPFYDLTTAPKDIGLGMMTLTIDQAKREGLKYVYLGSLQRPTDTYKLQFAGLEWFDGKGWQTDIEAVKKLLAEIKYKV